MGDQAESLFSPALAKELIMSTFP